jgi:uncharacterized protein (DUF2237 family)
VDDIKIVIDQNLEGKLHKFSEVEAKSLEIAQAIADKARELAPVVTGRYRDGIIVQKPNDKGTARVLATDQKSSWVEFGTAHGMEPHFTMRSAVEALGLKFKKGR